MSDELRKKAEELLRRNPEETPVLSTAEVQKLFHELDVHQIELQMQNEELRNAQAELARSRDAYAERYDFAPVGYLTLDPEGRISDANFTAATLLGVERGKLLGGTFAGFVHRDSLKAWDLHRRCELEHQERQGIDLIMQRPDGSTFNAHVECAPRPGSDHECGRCLMTVADITPRVEAEAHLVDAAERWQTTFDAMADAVFILDTDQHILHANKAASLVFGCPAEAMQGRHCWEVVHGTGAPVSECPVQRMLKTCHRESMELTSGDSCYQVTADPLIGEDGELCGAVHIVRNITAQKRAKQALKKSESELALLNLDLEKRMQEQVASLRESEERFRAMFEEAPDACFLVDLDGLFIDGNKAVEQQTGYRCEELVGQSVFESKIFPPAARKTVAERMERMVRGERIEPFEYDLVRKDGTELAVEVSTMPIRLQGKTVFLSTARDLTRRKQTERALQESEEIYRTTLDGLLVGVVVHAADTSILRSNPLACHILGLPLEQMQGKSPNDPAWCFLQEDLSAMPVDDYPVSRAISSGEKVVGQILGIRSPESEDLKWVTANAVPIFTQEGALDRVIVNFMDITAAKYTEQNLRESEEKYRQVFQSESDAIMIFDAETRQFVDVNNAAVELYGYSREECLQLTQSDITAEPKASDHSIKETLAGRIFSVPLRWHRKQDGTLFPVEIAACTFSWKGRPVVCGVIRDISRRVAREEELRKLTAEVSLAEQRERERIAKELHDSVSQLLSSSVLRLSVLKESSLPDAAVESIDTICGILRNTLEQTRSLTFELSCPMLNELGLAAALQELCSSMTREYSIRFEFTGDTRPLPLHMDHKIVLFRSVRELLINVMKHSAAGWACVHLEQVDDCVRVSVVDDGKGFDASLASREFSPNGGFGLFNIREYLHHAGGTLQIESVPGSGTKVVLTVPMEKDDE